MRLLFGIIFGLPFAAFWLLALSNLAEFIYEDFADLNSQDRLLFQERQIERDASRMPPNTGFRDLCNKIRRHETAMEMLLYEAAIPGNMGNKDALNIIQAARDSLIADYNHFSGQLYSREEFEVKNLPWELDRAPYDGTNGTSCIAD